MTEKLLGVSPPSKEPSPQPSAEELETARELVRQARTRGVALTGPSWQVPPSPVLIVVRDFVFVSGPPAAIM
jgi:hypothetical protein